jgi:dihydroorotase
MDPILDEPELADRLVRRIADQQLARVLPLGALTLGLGGERLSEMAGLRKAGCIAFSQANRPITDTQSLLRALEYAASFNFPVWLQPQDYYLGRGGVAHDGEVANRLGLAGIPVSAETIAIATLLTLAADVGVRLHLSHISSAAGIAMIASAQEEGIPVSCDVTIHHLHLSEHDIGFFDTNARFAPPLRSLRDRDGLRRAAAHGVASLCSNHSPHGRDHKLLPFDEAAPGSTGLELLLPLTLKWAAAEKLPLATALARLTSDPARILGRDDLGHLGLGATADVCLFDPEAEWQVSAENLQSRGKNTAFLGYPLTGRVRQTLVAGRPVLPA